MAIAPVKVILFLLGGTVAAGTTAYVAGVFDGYLGREPAGAQATDPATPKLAELPPAQMEARLPAEAPPAGAQPADASAEPAAPEVSDGSTPPADAAAGSADGATPAEAPSTATDEAGSPADAAATQPATEGSSAAGQPASDPAAPAAASDAAPAEETPQEMAALPQQEPDAPAAAAVVAPSFDIVRVEANGSIVIAGRAAANAKVEAVIGSRIIGATTAGDDGNFAIVLDDPLKPGDYQIVLRSTTPDGVVATSVETAVVSIPDTEDGQVLALVEQPGKAAELITVPEPQIPPAGQPAAWSGDQPAAGADAATPEAAAAGEPAADDNQQPAESAADTPATGEPDAYQPAAGAGDEPAVSADAPAAAAAGTDEPAGGTDEQSAESAAVQPSSEQPTAPKQDRIGPKVAVEAVEIEGRRIFIAGSADPGRLLRAYANEMLLGEALASAAGRFLIEAERDLPVGDYVIRVDALEPNGGKVVARAAVPFEREPGENIAAVAPPAGSSTPPADAAASASADTTPPQPAQAEAPATGEAPAPQPAERAADTAADDTAPPAGETAGQPAASSAQASAAAVPAPDIADATSPAADAPAADAAASPAAQQPAIASSASPDAQPEEALSPRLQAVDSAVIIRRGDTLWRISRRVYGRGIRYSTIYLANQAQIRDPDLIMPGQVFKVPDRSTEGEPADLTQMGEQAVPTPPAEQPATVQ